MEISIIYHNINNIKDIDFNTITLSNNLILSNLKYKTTGIYVICTSNNHTTLVKIGFSTNLKSRLESYICANPLTCILVIHNTSKAKELEQSYHIINEAISGKEWYDISKLDSIIYHINNFSVASKSIECVDTKTAYERGFINSVEYSFLSKYKSIRKPSTKQKQWKLNIISNVTKSTKGHIRLKV